MAEPGLIHLISIPRVGLEGVVGKRTAGGTVPRMSEGL